MNACGIFRRMHSHYTDRVFAYSTHTTTWTENESGPDSCNVLIRVCIVLEPNWCFSRRRTTYLVPLTAVLTFFKYAYVLLSGFE